VKKDCRKNPKAFVKKGVAEEDWCGNRLHVAALGRKFYVKVPGSGTEHRGGGTEFWTRARGNCKKERPTSASKTMRKYAIYADFELLVFMG